MKKNPALALVGGLAMALALSACGGGSGEDAEAAKAISQAMMDSSDSEFTVDQEQADCVGEGMVDKIGVDKLKEYGLLSEELETQESVTDLVMDQADAESAADVIVSCVDAQKLMADEFAADDSITAEQEECLGEVFDNDTLKDMFALIFQGKEDEATNQLMEPLMSCMM